MLPSAWNSSRRRYIVIGAIKEAFESRPPHRKNYTISISHCEAERQQETRGRCGGRTVKKMRKKIGICNETGISAEFELHDWHALAGDTLSASRWRNQLGRVNMPIPCCNVNIHKTITYFDIGTFSICYLGWRNGSPMPFESPLHPYSTCDLVRTVTVIQTTL